MAKIFIFRHGETYDNRDHIFSGWRDTELTPEGIEEARKIGEELKNEKVTKAYHSDQIRSKHTLDLVLGGFHPGVEIVIDPRIKERNYGDLTGLNKDEIEAKEPENYKLWHRSYDTPPPNGESIKDVEVRVISFLDELKSNLKPDDVVFISSSANAIRPMRKFFEGLTNEEMCSYEYTPGKIYSYEV